MNGRSADRDGHELAAIAREAEVELVTAETFEVTDMAPDDMDGLGYYEAELMSLRDAATTLDRAELGAE